MKLILKYYFHPYFLYFLRLAVLIIGALFFGGGCPSDPVEYDNKPIYPHKPQYLSITSISESVLRIEWLKDVSYNDTHYKIERADTDMIFYQVGATKMGTANFIDSTVNRYNIYYYRIRAIYDTLNSLYSDVVKVGYNGTFQLLRTIQTGKKISKMLITHDGGYLVGSCFTDSAINIWNTSTWSLSRTAGNYYGNAAMISSQDSKNIIIGGKNNIKIVSLTDLSVIRTINTDSAYTVDLALSSDGSKLISADDKGKLRLFQYINGNFLQNIDSTRYGSWGLATSSRNNIMIACSNEYIKQWDLNTLSFLRLLNQYYIGPVLNNDGSIVSVTTTSVPSTCLSLRTSDWSILYSFGQYVSSKTYSPDGSTLLIGDQNIIRVINVADGKVIQSLSAHSDIISGLVYFPDGKTFASGGFDESIKIWSVNQAIQWHILQ